MLKRFKQWVLLTSYKAGESRYSIFVWMRQVNDRLLRLEQAEAEQAVQERTESEALVQSRIDKVEAAQVSRETTYLNMIQDLQREINVLKDRLNPPQIVPEKGDNHDAS